MTRESASTERDEDLDELALARLTRVLGGVQARRIYDQTMRDTGLARLASADDLYTFATRLTARGGFEGAVGGLLSVVAVLRGASAVGR